MRCSNVAVALVAAVAVECAVSPADAAERASALVEAVRKVESDSEKQVGTWTVVLGPGTSVSVAVIVPRPMVSLVGVSLASEYEALVTEANRGNATAAGVLAEGLALCPRAFERQEDLDAAIRLLRERGALKTANSAVAVDVANRGPVEGLVLSELVTPYEVCRGLAPEVKRSAEQWRVRAIELNSRAALQMPEAIRGASTATQLHILDKQWQTGDAFALQAMADLLDGDPSQVVRAYGLRLAFVGLLEQALNESATPVRGRILVRARAALAKAGAGLGVEQLEAGRAIALQTLEANGRRVNPL